MAIKLQQKRQVQSIKYRTTPGYIVYFQFLNCKFDCCNFCQKTVLNKSCSHYATDSMPFACIRQRAG